MVQEYFNHGILRRVIENKLLTLRVINLRDYAVDDRGTIDSPPYGGGDGMILRPEPLSKAIDQIQNVAGVGCHVVVTCPSGSLFEQQKAETFLKAIDGGQELVIVCGRFGGIDQRFIDLYANERVSIGRYVLSGGELPALVITESIVRLIPGALGNPKSASTDSFGEEFGRKLEYPSFTRPQLWRGLEVPSVLISGDHQKISHWRRDHLK
jgi:tRNA (guanine37-N1)-methyltransferase